jgi:hypothetical protein
VQTHGLGWEQALRALLVSQVVDQHSTSSVEEALVALTARLETAELTEHGAAPSLWRSTIRPVRVTTKQLPATKHFPQPQHTSTRKLPPRETKQRNAEVSHSSRPRASSSETVKLPLDRKPSPGRKRGRSEDAVCESTKRAHIDTA